MKEGGKNIDSGNIFEKEIKIATGIKDKIVNNLYFYRKNIFDELKDYRIETGVKIVNPVSLCNRFGIKIVAIDLNKGDGLIGSYGMNSNKEDFIFVDEKENRESLINIIAHEVAYYLLVKKTNMLPKRLPGNTVFDKYKKDFGNENPNINKVCDEFIGSKNPNINKMCDEFTRDALMPEDYFRKVYKGTNKNRIAEAAYRFKVDESQVIKRAKDLKLYF